ncbi:unnamed protein product, partial [Sphacelaria rigidula]
GAHFAAELLYLPPGDCIRSRFDFLLFSVVLFLVRDVIKGTGAAGAQSVSLFCHSTKTAPGTKYSINVDKRCLLTVTSQYKVQYYLRRTMRPLSDCSQRKVCVPGVPPSTLVLPAIEQ